MLSEEEYEKALIARLEALEDDEEDEDAEEKQQYSEVVLVTTDGIHIKSYDCYGTSDDNLTNLLNRGFKDIIEYPEMECVMLSLTEDPRDFLYREDWDEMLEHFESILPLSGREDTEN